MGRIKQFLMRHPLFETLLGLEGNPRACVYTEPLWGIPYNIYIPYATLYMYELGIHDRQIGLLLSIGMAFQWIAAFFGGVITDKLGRRKTTAIFDIVSWSIPTLIWAFSQNFWWFVAAAVFNSVWQVTDTSWTCLLVEDCEPEKMVNVYTWVTVSGLLAVFFAPVASGFIGDYGVVPTMRVLYFITFLMMSTKFITLYLCSTETRQGRVRMEQTRGVPIWRLVGGYRDVIRKILHTPAMLLAITMKVIVFVTSMVTTNFFALYATQNLGVPDSYMGYFPIARAAVMLVFIFTFQGRVNRMRFRPIMIAGAALYIAADVVLFLSVGTGAGILLLYILFDAFGAVLLVPRNDSLSALFIDKEERARVTGLMFMATLALSTPFGALVGILSDLHRILPFVFNACLYGACIVILAVSKPLKEYDRMIQAGEMA